MNGKGMLKMSDRTVSYDFQVDSVVSIEAPYGTDPATLLGQALIKLVQKVNHREMELRCIHTYDPETGYYEEVPEEWYKD